MLNEYVQDPAPLCMLFIDDIVLIGEPREEPNGKLMSWREALKAHDFRISRSKTKYRKCKLAKDAQILT